MSDLPVFYLEARLETFESNNLGYHTYIKISDEIAAVMFYNNARRVTLYYKDLDPIPAAIMKSKEFYYILISNALLKSFKKKQGEMIAIKLVADRSEYGMPMPEEFTAIFEYDEEARIYFEKLTPGKKRSLMYIISKIKSPNLRAEKSIIMMEHIKANKGKIDYKLLNVAMKQGLG